MATPRQIESNQKNALRSTGPRTPQGKSRSRLNGTKHGLASESTEIEAEFSPEFAERRARWAAEHELVGEAASWAMDKAVAASLRIDRCERAVENLITSVKIRAELTWDQDREVEAAEILGRVSRDPVLAPRRLQTTLAGVTLLIESWLGLVAKLETGENWSEQEASKALDLLGVATDLRSGRTLIDGPEGSEPIAYRLELALNEFERLRELRDEALTPIDELDRRQAMAGDIALLSKPAKLLLRYERDAWRRYRDAMTVIKAQPPAPVVAPKPAPIPTPKPAPVADDRPIAPRSRFEDERRELQALAAPLQAMITEELKAMGFADEDAWIDELDRRIEARGSCVTDRTRFAGVASEPA